MKYFKLPGFVRPGSTANNLSLIILLMSIFLLPAFSGCDKDNDSPAFAPDFSFELADDNHVQFTNTSTGEYYSLVWDFGNQQADTSTDRSKSYVIYYPVAGEYQVSLKLLNFTGETKNISKTINITNTDLALSFTAEVLPDNPNKVRLTNTSQGMWDSFMWIYRNKEVADQTEYDAYFPYSGNHEIELLVNRDNNSFSLKKSVSIAQDDPDYIQNLTLAWSDEFDGAEVNQDNWTFETGASGWGNNELQNYTNGDNAEIVDGVLVITARKVNENTVPGSYTSSRIVTNGKHEFQYGHAQIRAKLPSGTGIWPALWMLGSNFNTAGWPACGEMDIMEYVGYDPNVVHSTVHTPAGFGGNGNGSSIIVESCEEEFHVYGLIWTEKRLVFYVDTPDNVIHTYAPPVKTDENWPFNKPAFFIMNVAVGGNWGGAQGIDNTIFPQTLQVDYVRMYQEP